MKSAFHVYSRSVIAASYLHFLMLLEIRLHCGWQFAHTIWGKLCSIAKFTGFFTTFNLPFPEFDGQFLSVLKFIEGMLLTVRLSTPLARLLPFGNRQVTYWTVDRKVPTSIFSDLGKFYLAEPCTYFFASVIAPIFGASLFSLESLLMKRVDTL